MTTEARSKQALDAKRGVIFTYDPTEVVIVGRDKADVYTTAHPLFQKRALRGVNVLRCLNMIRHGFPGVIKVCPGAGPDAPVNPTGGGAKEDILIVSGRGRTIDGRHANMIIDEWVRLLHTGTFDGYEERDALEAAVSKALTKVAGFEVPVPTARWLIAKGEKAPKIRCEVKPARGDAAYLIGQANAENAPAFRDKDDDVWTQAEAIQRFIHEGQGHNLGEAEAAIEFGLTPPVVRDRLALLKCAPEVREQAEAGLITASDAVKLAGLPDNLQVERLTVIPKKDPSKKRRGRAHVDRRGPKIAERVCDYLGPGHDVSRFWKFMSGEQGGLEALLKVDKGLKEIVAPEKPAKPVKVKKVKKGAK